MPLAMKRYLIALDPGQKQDPAAIQVYKAVPEVVHPDPLLNTTAKVIYRDDIVMQYRVADKRYTELVDFVLSIMQRPSLSSESVLVFDATGVGTAVKDMLAQRGVKDMIPIVYTAGGKASYVYRDEQDKRFQFGQRSTFSIRALDEIRVPKPDLVDAARLEMERHAVRFAKGVPYREDFQKQMMEFTGKMNKKGYVSYNNSSDEIHDDWVNCFMMRSYIRRRFRADIYREEDLYTNPEENELTLSTVLGDRGKAWWRRDG